MSVDQEDDVSDELGVAGDHEGRRTRREREIMAVEKCLVTAGS